MTWDGLEVSTPYRVSEPFQKQRQIAASMETIFVYDFLPLIEHAVSKIWKQRYAGFKYSAATAGRRKPSMAGPHSLLSQLQAQYSNADAAHTSFPERESAYAELKSEEEATHSTFLPKQLLKAVELVLGKDAQGNPTLLQTERAPGNNNIGMVAWLLTLYTPELAGAPGSAGNGKMSPTPAASSSFTANSGSLSEGRQVVLISNDITFQAGTFGPQEDLLFDLASKFARARGIPRWYFSANSGARIGLAEELRHKFKIAWQDDNPLKGFAYLYLTEADHATLASSVLSERVVTASGEVRYSIKDIIGARDGLGVENLRGSGTIAGETSRAYEDIFTL